MRAKLQSRTGLQSPNRWLNGTVIGRDSRLPVAVGTQWLHQISTPMTDEQTAVTPTLSKASGLRRLDLWGVSRLGEDTVQHRMLRLTNTRNIQECRLLPARHFETTVLTPENPISSTRSWPENFAIV